MAEDDRLTGLVAAARELAQAADAARGETVAEREALEARVAELERLVEETRAEASQEVTRVLDATRREMERMVQTLAESDSRGESLAAEVERERARGGQLERRIETVTEALRSARTHAERQARELRQRDHALAERDRVLDEQRSELEARADDLARRVGELERALGDARATIDSERARRERVEHDLAHATSREREQRRLLEQAEAEGERRAAALGKLHERVDEASVRAEELAARLAARTEELGDADRRLRDAAAELERVSGDRDELERRADESERALRAELAEARAEAERERADRDGLRSRLRALLEAPVEEAAAEAPEPPPVEAAPASPAPVAPAGPDPPTRRRMFRRRPPADQPTECAVCHRPAGSRGVDALRASGWNVEGEVGVCARCRGRGWELDVAAGAPVRVSAR